MFAEMDRSVWLWVIPLLLVMRYGGYIIKSKRLSAFIHPRLWGDIIPDLSSSRRILKVLMVVLGMLCVILAYMQPQFGRVEQTVVHQGSHVVIAVDTSVSMLAEDLPENRLAYAKREIKSFIDQSQGDKIGLVVFSGNAFVHCPFTSDYEALKLFVDDIRPGMMPRQGTNLAAAIRKSRDMIGPKRYDTGAIIVFSDGEFFEGSPVRSAEVSGKVGVPIYVVGLGSESGNPIPLKDSNGVMTGYKKDREGQVVLSRLNRSTLNDVAKAASGKAFFVSENRVVSDALYKVLSEREGQRIQGNQSSQLAERYQWPLLLGFVFLIIELGFSAAKKRALMGILVMMMALPVWGDMGLQSYRQLQAGNRYLESGQPELALSRYAPLQSNGVDDPALAYNLGMAFYAQGDYDQAKGLFESALYQLPDRSKEIQFQLSNVMYQKEQYQQAVDSYAALAARYPDWEAVRHNLELSLQKLQAMQQESEGSSADQSDADDQEKQAGDDEDASQNASSESNGEAGDPSDTISQPSQNPTKKASDQVVEQFLSTMDQQEAAARQQFQRQFTEGGGQVSHDW